MIHIYNNPVICMDISIKYTHGISKMEFEKKFMIDFSPSVEKYMEGKSPGLIIDSKQIIGIISQNIKVGCTTDNVSIPIINQNCDGIGYVDMQGYKSVAIPIINQKYDSVEYVDKQGCKSIAKPIPVDIDELDKKEINVSLLFECDSSADEMSLNEKELLAGQARDKIRTLQRTQKYQGKSELAQFDGFVLHIKDKVEPINIETNSHRFFLSTKSNKEPFASIILNGWYVEGEPWLDPNYSEEDEYIGNNMDMTQL